MKKRILLALLVSLLISCKGQENTSSNIGSENLESSVEDAVTSISVLLDDAQGESYATLQKKSFPELIEDLFVPKAYAASCIRPIYLSCNNGLKSSTFSDCSLYSGQVLASGQIDLNFSQNDCSMSLIGDQVNRTFDYELVGPRGGQLFIDSDSHVDYRGHTIGGGAELIKTSIGWDLNILGKHKVLTRNGRKRMDKSLRSLTPLEISGGLARGQRRVNKGQLEVIHNLAQFTATYTAQDLRWNSSCCHPVSGSLIVEYTGSQTGSATIEFNSCGEAEIEKNGEVQNVQFTYCE